MKSVLILVLLASCAAFAQDAVVVELSKCDADQAKKLYDAKKKADADYDALVARVGREHNLPSFDFSKDFRFIVPKASPSFNLNQCCGSNGYICLSPCSNGTNWISPAGSSSNFILNGIATPVSQ